MAKSNTHKNKDKKKKKSSKAVDKSTAKKPKANSQKQLASSNKSLKSLAKIQKQLDKLVSQRKQEKQFVDQLKNSVNIISKQLQAIEKDFPKFALRKDLKKLKADLKKKKIQFQDNTDHLTRQIAIFEDLSNRAEHKMMALQQELEPNTEQFSELSESHQQLSNSHQQLSDSHQQLFEKLNQFEQSLTQVIEQFEQPESNVNNLIDQFEQLTDQVNIINSNVQSQEQQIIQLEDGADSFSHTSKTIQDELQKIDEQLASIMPQLAEINPKLAELEPRLGKIEPQLDELKPQFDKLKPELSALKPELAALKNEHNTLKQQADNLATKLHTIQESTRNQQQTLLDTIFQQAKETMDVTLKKSENLSNELIKQQLDDYSKTSSDEFKTQVSKLQEKIEALETLQSSNLDPLDTQVQAIQKQIAKLAEHDEERDSQVKLLRTDVTNIHQSLEQIQDIEGQIANLIPKLNEVDEDNQSLKKQTSKLAEDIQVLTQKNEQMGLNLIETIQEQSQAYLTSALSENQEKTQQHFNEQLKQQSDAFTEQSTQLNQLSNDISALQSIHDEVINPIKGQLNEFEQGIEYLTQESKNHQQALANDAEQFTTIVSKVDQFESLLGEIQSELNQQIENLRETELQAQTKQITNFAEQLDQLSQQINDILSQSSELQSLLDSVQNQQETYSSRHDELAKQYLNQQQKLDGHDSVIAKLDPLAQQSNTHTEQLEQVADTLEKLASAQGNLSKAGNQVESHVNELSQKLEKNHSSQQKQVNHLIEQQEVHATEHNLTRVQLKQRTIWLSLGLLAAFGALGLLLFKQDLLPIKDDSQQLLSQLKQETYKEINDLTRKNSVILNKELTQLKQSIQQLESKQPAIPTQLPSKQLNVEILQDDVLKLQTEQHAMNQTVIDLSQQVTKQEQLTQQLIKETKKITATHITSSSPTVAKRYTGLGDIPEIQEVSGKFYTIQLLGAQQKNSIIPFLKQHQLPGNLRIYSTQLNNKPWHVLVIGHYASFGEAARAIKQLPQSLAKQKPWVRKIP